MAGKISTARIERQHFIGEAELLRYRPEKTGESAATRRPARRRCINSPPRQGAKPTGS
jgi:hypothetical protein